MKFIVVYKKNGKKTEITVAYEGPDLSFAQAASKVGVSTSDIIKVVKA